MPPREGKEIGWSRIPVERGKFMVGLSARQKAGSSRLETLGMTNQLLLSKTTEQVTLFPLFRSRLGQRLQFLLVFLHLAGFVHLIAEVAEEEAEDLRLFVLHEAVADLVFLGGKIGVGGGLALGHGENCSRGGASYGTADFAGFQRKCHRGGTGH